MLKDFNILEYSFDDEIRIIPISDTHIGSSSFMEKEFKETIKLIADNPNIYTILVGDICDNAVLTGKNLGIFDNVMTPMQQAQKAIELLRPIKDKILCSVLGNHEKRSIGITSINPMSIVCAELGLMQVYRDSLAIVKIKIGKREEKQRATYTMLVHHGVGTDSSALKKDREFINNFEGADIIVTGHTHQGKCSQHIKKVIDTHNNNVFERVVSCIICNSYLSDASYSIGGMMTGTPHSLIYFDLKKKREKKVIIHID